MPLDNVERDPRVSVMVWDAGSPYRFIEAQGRVTQVVRGPEAREHIDACALRYLERPYPAEQITSERAILRITPDRINRRGL